MATRALIIVDVQNDFCSGGALPVPDGDRVVPVINDLASKFRVKIKTMDWHPKDHCSFVDNGGQWPSHCVQGSSGARSHRDIVSTLAVFFKGTKANLEAYSGFGTDGEDTGLETYLKLHGVKTVYICGLATDYCVKETVLDALDKGYEVFVVEDACRAVNVNPDDGENALADLWSSGAKIVESKNVEPE